MIKFISYTGKFPNLCSGTLTVEHDGTQYEINGNKAFYTGGNVSFSAGWEEDIEIGAWGVFADELPPELEEHWEKVEEIMNDNVQHGCCGGCI